jgi:hypothetical protein
MANDRFVRFGKRRPARDDVRKALEDYMTGAGRVERVKDRFFVYLRGKGSHPARRLAGAHPSAKVAAAKEGSLYRAERFIEVWVDKAVVDVITRQADDYTNAVADGFVEFLTTFWDGTVDR